MNESNRLSAILSRQPPYSLEAEQALLGAIILDSEKFAELDGNLKPEDFYVERHKVIFSALRDMYLESRSIDIITLLGKLSSGEEFNEQAARNYVKQLCELVPSLSNLKDYSGIIKDKSLLRSLIRITEEISEDAYLEQDEADRILNAAEAKIFALTQGKITGDFVHIHDVILEYYAHLDQLKNDKEAVNGTPTFFSALDKLLVGMGKGDLILVGARPGMGKTSFAMNIATQVARKSGKAIAVFSLEMSALQLVGRMLSSEARIDSYKMRTGDLSPDEYSSLANSATALSKTQILIDDTSDITVSRMKAKLRRVKNLGLIVIDYLQLMQSDRKIDNRVLEVADISRNLKIMAKEFGVPIITCAQLSRGPESRKPPKPMLSDLRDSGAIEQDADVVIFLYREEYYEKENADNIAEINVAKNRHGSTGIVKLGWEGCYTRFTTLDETHDV